MDRSRIKFAALVSLTMFAIAMLLIALMYLAVKTKLFDLGDEQVLSSLANLILAISAFTLFLGVLIPVSLQLFFEKFLSGSEYYREQMLRFRVLRFLLNKNDGEYIPK